MKEIYNYIIAGLGGQGILLMTKIMAEAAILKGYPVMGAETHGMAQRGGSVISHLRVGEANSTLVRKGTAHYLISLNENEALRNLSFLAPFSTMYVNARQGLHREEVMEFLNTHHIKAISFDATGLAVEMGQPQSTNLAMLGVYAAHEEFPFGFNELYTVLEAFSKETARKDALKIFQGAYSRAKEALAK